MSYDYLLFDLDGTLTESGPGIMHSAAWALEQLGVDPGDEDQLRRVVGPPLSESYRRFYGLSPAQTEEAVRLFRLWYNEQGGIFESEPYAHIPAMLRELKELGKHLLVATSKPEPMARRVLEHWGLTDYFEAVFAGTLDEKGCVKSAIVERAVKWCSSEAAGRILMIGDREYDVLGAHANGVPCAGVLWGYGSREEFEKAGAEYILQNGEELLELAKA